MIYGYIFVMAGVTYLIRMLPLTLIQKKNNKCLLPFLFILYSLCLPYCNDIPGNSLRHAVSSLRNGGICDRGIPCAQKEKSDRCSRMRLCRGVFGRAYLGNVTDMLTRCEAD